MSFAADVKNSLARLVPEEKCCRAAELGALLRMGSGVTFGRERALGLTFATKNAAVARKVLQLLKLEAPGLHTEVSATREKSLRKTNTYRLRVAPAPAVTALLKRLGFLKSDSLNIEEDSALLKKPCCRASYLRGAFLGGGSVNRPEAAYHLELNTGSFSFGRELYSLMRRLGFPVGFTDRKDTYVIYLKEGDAVIDFLAMIGAGDAAEAFEVARNVKEVRAQVNRLVNCETANLQKAVDAAGRQIEKIKSLDLEALPPKLKATARARLDAPEATLAELAALLKITKSGLAHRLRKLEAMAEEKP